MTRAEQIRDLQVRYLLAVSQHKRKTAALIFARMKSLMTRQLAYEIRQDRKSSRCGPNEAVDPAVTVAKRTANVAGDNLGAMT